jgi:hypothetical protein
MFFRGVETTNQCHVPSALPAIGSRLPALSQGHFDNDLELGERQAPMAKKQPCPRYQWDINLIKGLMAIVISK